MVNVELIYYGLKNKADYIFDKRGMKKDVEGMDAKTRPGIAAATTWAQK